MINITLLYAGEEDHICFQLNNL